MVLSMMNLAAAGREALVEGRGTYLRVDDALLTACVGPPSPRLVRQSGARASGRGSDPPACAVLAPIRTRPPVPCWPLFRPARLVAANPPPVRADVIDSKHKLRPVCRHRCNATHCYSSPAAARPVGSTTRAGCVCVCACACACLRVYVCERE